MDEAMLTAFTTAATAVQANVTEMITKALPVGLAIMGTILAIRIGVNFFKSLASN